MKKKIEKKKVVKEDKMKSLLEELLLGLIGKAGEQIVGILYKKKNVNEFLISKKLNLTINQTRNILYRLSDKGLVYFIRKKDSKKGGWYTYFWTLNIKKSLELLHMQINDKIEKIEEELSRRKSERFYYSPGANIEYTEEEALEHNFICPETGEVLELRDNSNSVGHLEDEVSKLKLLIEEVNVELESVVKKMEKDKEKRLKLEAKKKEEERRLRREKLKKLRAKEERAKNNGKKKVKKGKKKVKKAVKKKGGKKVSKKVKKKRI